MNIRESAQDYVDANAPAGASVDEMLRIADAFVAGAIAAITDIAEG